MNEKWYVAAKKADFQGIAKRFGIDPVTVRIIRNRDVVGDDEIRQYLYGTRAELGDPAQLQGGLEAASLLKQKIEAGKKIRIIGDYDIDGVNSTYILYRALTRCGAQVDYEIPDRMKDGYGLNISLLKLALEEGIDTVLTCDNGISAIAEIAYAKENGMTVIVTDHHEPLFEEVPEEDQAETIQPQTDTARRIPSPDGTRIFRLPPADVLVNPKQPNCRYPYKKLCGAAVAWKVVCLLYRLYGMEEEAEQFLQFVGFATVGDVMELDGENRILVKEGLKQLRITQNYGWRALIQANNLDFDTLNSYHIGFVLGPCINASGRLDTAKRSLRLLLAKDAAEAELLAARLKQLNDERKELTQAAVDLACEQIDGSTEANDRVLVVYLPDCHESIAGIVAGRIRERYGKPTFVVTNAEAEDEAKGSGRSIEAYSMFEEMVKCQDLFRKFGGHPMAAGFSLPRSRIDEMRRRLNENCTMTEEDMAEKIMVDVPMPINYIRESLVEELAVLEPFGNGNEKPLFAERHLKLLSARILGKNANVLKLQVANATGCTMEALYFGIPDNILSYLTDKYGKNEVQKLLWGKVNQIEMDLTYYPSINEYQGRRTLQIVIKNFR
ncbi:MAG: DHHA1 domain-containing protein [Lachnospiraceae bacterium]|nr:DHHA1 domain-containing protein [Lachnospiraceae bacterium]